MGLLLSLDFVFGIAALYLVFLASTSWGSQANRAPLPPGPRPLPLIGNLLDIIYEYKGQPWTRYKALYGPISSVRVFGRTIIILNELTLAFKLLEKRSLNYSNRPVFIFGGELCGVNRGLPCLQYGDRFRKTRRLLHQFMGTHVLVSDFEAVEVLEARRFLLRVLQTPEQIKEHVRTMTGSVILKIVYGYTINSAGSDPLIELADATFRRFSLAFQPGTWLVDVLPSLKYLPEELPGMEFKKIAREWKAKNLETINKPFEFVRRQLATGSASRSFVSINLEQCIGKESEEEDEELIKWAASVIYGGGAQTMISALSTFILAMFHFPSVFERAQEEVDTVIGNDRLPSFSDRSRLPYVNALVKETLRWNVVNQTEFPHVSAEDDTCLGYFIPKGSIILPNICHISHDQQNYLDPWVFEPERFLGGDEAPSMVDPYKFAFGFGRRICPGKELADATLYITVAMYVAAFKFQTQEINFSSLRDSLSAMKSPINFRFTINPRSEKASKLIWAVHDEHPWGAGDADCLEPPILT